MQQKAAKWLQALIYSAAAVGGVWLAVRFLLPWTAPFLLAFSAAALFEPVVRALMRHGWRRGAAAGVLTVAGLAALAYLALSLPLLFKLGLEKGRILFLLLTVAFVALSGAALGLFA